MPRATTMSADSTTSSMPQAGLAPVVVRPDASEPAIRRARITLEHYEHMIECGAFAPPFDLKVELLNGEIVEMLSEGPVHADDSSVIAEWSYRVTSDQPIKIRNQHPIRIPPSDSLPEPDICWVRDKSYRQQHPGPEDVLLAIEIAETSLPKDRGPKLAVYAEAGISEYWIVNLVDEQIEVYREPQGKTYSKQMILKRGEKVAPLALPTAELEVDRLFPSEEYWPFLPGFLESSAPARESR